MSAKYWSDGNVSRQRALRGDGLRARKRNPHRSEEEAALYAEVQATQEAMRFNQIAQRRNNVVNVRRYR